MSREKKPTEEKGNQAFRLWIEGLEAGFTDEESMSVAFDTVFPAPEEE